MVGLILELVGIVSHSEVDYVHKSALFHTMMVGKRQNLIFDLCGAGQTGGTGICTG